MAENNKPNENEKQAVLVELEARNALVEYLGTKPHNEVRRFVDILVQAPVVNVTLTPNAPAGPDDSKLASTARGKAPAGSKKGTTAAQKRKGVMKR